MITIFQFPKYYQIHVNEETGETKIYSKSKHAKGRELSQFPNPDGYLRVKMNNRAHNLHVLIAAFYLGDRPKGLVVNHKDGNKLNNKPDNLEYVSVADNIRHSVKMGMHVANDPKRSGRYIDGRAVDPVKYKREWYLKNREQILKKAAERYTNNKL